MGRYTVKFNEDPKTGYQENHRIDLIIESTGQVFSFSREEATEAGELFLSYSRYWDSRKKIDEKFDKTMEKVKGYELDEEKSG